MANPRHKEHKSMKDWILNGRMGAGPWDPDHFDPTEVKFEFESYID